LETYAVKFASDTPPHCESNFIMESCCLYMSSCRLSRRL